MAKVDIELVPPGANSYRHVADMAYVLMRGDTLQITINDRTICVMEIGEIAGSDTTGGRKTVEIKARCQNLK